MIDLMPIELMIQKSGISAYIRLKKTASHTISNERENDNPTSTILGKPNTGL